MVPTDVKAYVRRIGFNAVRMLVKGHPDYGDVYEAFRKSAGIPIPTGMPVILSYKDGKCAALSNRQAFELLSSLEE